MEYMKRNVAIFRVLDLWKEKKRILKINLVLNRNNFKFQNIIKDILIDVLNFFPLPSKSPNVEREQE